MKAPGPKRARSRQPETALYAPLKRHFTSMGLCVKGEVWRCDVVGLTSDEPPFVVVCEIKAWVSFEVVLQAVDRIGFADQVYIAVPESKRGNGRENDRRFRKLCRMLGFGLITVAANGRVRLLVNPGPYRPRPNLKRRNLLIREHRQRQGDPTPGGTVNEPIETAYRQKALAAATALQDGPRRVRDVKKVVPSAQRILWANHYGWFWRIRHGVYGLTESGREALESWLHKKCNADDE